ncbi:MAG: insulinase family protein [Candidatus Paceibacterota bacterium]
MQFGDRQEFIVQVLKNGITLRCHPMEVPFVNVRVLIPVGNVHSHTGNEAGALGIAHFLEHMCFERSKLYPEKHAFERLLSSRGSDWNACTGPFATEFYMRTPAEDLIELLPGFLSHVFDPLLLEEDIDLQRGIVRNERQQRKYFPGDNELGEYQFTKWMQGRYFSKEQLFGDDAALAAFSHEQLSAFQQHYLSDQIEVLVGGTFDETAVRAALETIPTKPMHQLKEVRDEIGWANRSYHEATFKDIDIPEYFWGGNTAQPNLDTWLFISFITDYLTDANTGILTNWLRKEKGWSYGVSHAAWFAQDRIGWMVNMPVNDTDAVAAIRAELHERVRTALADADSVRTARIRVQKESRFLFETLASRLDTAGDFLVEFGEIMTETYAKDWFEAHVNPTDLTAAYERLFSPKVTGEFLALPTTQHS